MEPSKRTCPCTWTIGAAKAHNANMSPVVLVVEIKVVESSRGGGATIEASSCAIRAAHAGRGHDFLD